jgi:hypothetical protein
MQHDVDVKSQLCTVRLTTRQVEVLDGVAHGEFNRAQVVRMLVENFVRKPEQDRRAFVVKQLFGETA